MLKTICYISNINKSTTEIEVNHLSKIISHKNDINNITGVMIIQNGHFLQIMEGKEDIIEILFEKIKLDKRHSGLIKLLHKKIDYPMFVGYGSGSFSVIKDFANLKKLRIYFDWIKSANILEIDELIILTNNFLKYST